MQGSTHHRWVKEMSLATDAVGYIIDTAEVSQERALRYLER